jgi:hypothetical protein
MHQVLPADQNACCLRATNILAPAESDHVEAKRGIFPEPFHGRYVRGCVVKGKKLVLLRNGDGFRAAHFAFVGENVGEVNRYRFGLMAATISSRVSTSTSFAPVCRIWWSNGWRWLFWMMTSFLGKSLTSGIESMRGSRSSVIMRRNRQPGPQPRPPSPIQCNQPETYKGSR